MDRFPLRFLLAFLILAAGAVPTGAAGAGAPASVEDLAWIAGHWQGRQDGDLLDEQWSAPAGGTMIGMFRWIKGGRIHLYEFLAIETAADGRPVLLLKHFDPGLVGWEEKAEVWSYPLTGGGPREAVFTRPDGGTRMTFRLTSEETMTVLLERRKDGAWQTEPFLYTRAK